MALPPAVIVRGRAEAEAVLAAAAGRAVLLLSPPEAARVLGPGWWLAMLAAAEAAHPGSAVTGVLDCGASAGLAQAALAAGARGLVFTGPAAQAARLASVAASSGALMLRARPEALAIGAYGGLRKLPAWLSPVVQRRWCNSGGPTPAG
jgi:hypothetical protein